MYDIFMNDAMFDADNMMEENNFETVSPSDYEVSFMGYSQVDAIYDPYLERAETQFKIHEKDFHEADNMQDAQLAWNNMKQDEMNYSYWEGRKREAELMDEKNQIFKDHINAQLEIIEKYRK